ncbi:MAG: MFS transporter [Terriglobia bacterium]|nr:MFS transporter [Terriglobia bacterium]
MEIVHKPDSRIGRMRWFVCALLFLATTTNYMDRQVLGILAPVLQKDLHWTEESYGNMIACFTFAYGLSYILAGRVIDRLGTRKGYGLFVAIWSISSAAHAFVNSAFGFGVARFFLGIGESGNFPAALKAVAEWFPKEERALATGIFNSGTNFAALLAPIIIPFIALRWGWRYGFIFTASMSMLWLIGWLLFPYNRLRPDETQLTDSRLTPAELVEKRSLWSFLTDRGTIAFAGAKFLTDPVWWFYLFWGPLFLTSRFHISIAQMSIPLVVIYFGASIGSIFGGWLSGFWIKHGRSINFSRKMAMGLFALAALPVTFAAQVSTLWMSVSLITIAAAAHQGFSCNIFSTPSDMFRARSVATVVGIGGTAGALGGTVFAAVAGFLLNRTHNYSLLFAVCGCSYVLAMVLFQLLVPQLRHQDSGAERSA